MDSHIEQPLPAVRDQPAFATSELVAARQIVTLGVAGARTGDSTEIEAIQGMRPAFVRTPQEIYVNPLPYVNSH